MNQARQYHTHHVTASAMDRKSQAVMLSHPQEIIQHQGKKFVRQVLLADATIPYKLSIDRRRNKLFFCINADDFSDQSFHLVSLDLGTGITSIIQGIRNGYASTVDHATSTVYLGGSNGIFKYNYVTSAAVSPVLKFVDIFDLFFKDELYFVDTAKQALSILRDNAKIPVNALKGHLIQHFILDGNEAMYFLNSTGLYTLTENRPLFRVPDSDSINFRGAAVDINGRAHFIAENGIYQIDEDTKLLKKWLPVNNGYGLAFDQYNNVIYSDERSISIIYPLENNRKS